MWETEWASEAACRFVDPERLFYRGAAQNREKAICAQCPVRLECLTEALTNRINHGVWGGMTERERRALLRRSPDDTDWAAVLKAERAAS